jgi:hypothetical protein
MALHRLNRESLSEVRLTDGTASHKFLSTPFKIFFGTEGEYHKTLLGQLRSMSEEDPELLESDRNAFEQQSMTGCGSHIDTQELAVIDAGLLVVEGIEIPETISFTDRSKEYGVGDRMRTQMIAEAALRGTWKMHLPPNAA